MATYSLAPNVKRQYLDDSGNPLANGRIYTFVAGTTTPLETYQTSSGTSWGSFVQLDAAGRPDGSSEIYLLPGLSYKFTARDSNLVDVWTQDNIAAVPLGAPGVDIAITAGQDITAGQSIYLSRGTGGLTAGRWYLTDADLAYASSVPLTAIAVVSTTTGNTGTARLTGTATVNQVLSTGSDYFVGGTAGALTTTAGANVRYMGRATSTTQLELAGNPRPETTTYNLQTDFGALIDGTTDDSSAMTAALAVVAAAGGGTIYIPAGICVLASLATLATDHTRIVGDGPGVTTIKGTGTTGVIKIEGDFCGLENLYVHFTGAGSYGVKIDNGTHEINIGANRPNFRNVKIKGDSGTVNGLWLVNSLNGTFSDLYLPNGGGTAVLLESSAFHTFTDLQIVNLGDGADQWTDGLVLQLQSTNIDIQSDDNVFVNANVSNCTRHGIHLKSTIPSGAKAGEPPARNVFVGGASQGNTTTNVYIEEGKDNRFYGMHCETAVKSFHIDGNDGNHVNKFYGCSGQFDIDNPSTAQGIQATIISGHSGDLTIGGSKVFGTQVFGLTGSLVDNGTNTLSFQSFLATSPNAATSYRFNTREFSAGPQASANAVQGSGGSPVTIVALPATSYGTVHVFVRQSGTTNVTYYQVLFVNGTGVAISTPGTSVTASAGGTTADLTFSLSGSNLQAQGVNATAPDAVYLTLDYWPNQ